MRLTKQTNYAVRMLMYCAANDGKLSRFPEIARAYGVSDLFLFKILPPLTRANSPITSGRGDDSSRSFRFPATSKIVRAEGSPDDSSPAVA